MMSNWVYFMCQSMKTGLLQTFFFYQVIPSSVIIRMEIQNGKLAARWCWLVDDTRGTTRQYNTACHFYFLIMIHGPSEPNNPENLIFL